MDYTHLRQQIPSLEWSGHLPEMAAELRSLIHHGGSMTKRLQQLSRLKHPKGSSHLSHFEQMRVHVLNETLSNQALWEREVLLHVHGEACIWAHSQIPLSLRAQPLADRPLGEWMFAQYQVTRTQIDYASIRYDSLTLPIRRSHLQPVAHRPLEGSTDCVATHLQRPVLEPPILVIECFLPCILDLLRDNSG